MIQYDGMAGRLGSIRASLNIRICMRIICGCLALLGLLLSVAALWSRYSLSRSDSQLMIVSNRAKVMDVAYLLDSKDTTKVEYIRTSEPFARSLAIQFHFDLERPDSIHFILFRNTKAEKYLSQSAGEALFSSITTKASLAESFPYIPALICFGIALGLIFPIKMNLLSSATIALSLVSAVKYLTACPTCPTVTIVGIDAALVGVFTFGVLGGLLHSKPNSLSVRVAVLVIISFSLGWQLISWWEGRLQCAPCSTIGLLSGMILASSDHILDDASPSILSQLAISGSIVMAIGLFAYQGGFTKDSSSTVKPSRHLAALGMAKTPVIKSCSEVGIKPTGRFSIIVIGAFGCHACEVASQSIEVAGLKMSYFIQQL